MFQKSLVKDMKMADTVEVTADQLRTHWKHFNNGIIQYNSWINCSTTLQLIRMDQSLPQYDFVCMN